MSQIRKRTQNVDYLGTLSTLLRDLQGYSTLAHELIQNADDVKDMNEQPGTTAIEFDVHDDALYVSNDGVFREIDFKRMENIAGQHKRQEENTTGAFGIGFLSVYQITDSPEIFSSGLHWRFIPTNYPDNIEEQDIDTSGTQFRLPYAIDPETQVRKRLHQQAFEKSRLSELEQALANAIVNAAPFLKQLNCLIVKRSGKIIQRVTREVTDDGVLILDINGETSRWFLLDGNFEDEADRLKSQYLHQIERKRHHRVTVAIPESTSIIGKLFAVLPTETTTELPFHINADFFPSADRKKIIFQDDYQSEWNRACIKSVIDILSGEIDNIRDHFGHVWFWNFLNQLNMSGQKAKSGGLDKIFLTLWDEIKKIIVSKEIIYTSSGQWVQTQQARILQSQSELEASSIIEKFGINVVSPDLRPYYNLLIEFGTPFLSVEDIADSLHSHGLNKRQHISSAPDFLRDKSAWQLLWRAIDERISKIGKSQKPIAESRLKSCAIFLDAHDYLQLAADIYIDDGETNTGDIFWWANWLTPDAENDAIPATLAEPFVLSCAIYELERLEDIEKLWLSKRLDLPALFKWFQDHLNDFKRYPQSLRDRFFNLPIFPVSGHLTNLTKDLYVPSDFNDPFGTSSLIDTKAIGKRKEFLIELGVKELNLINFIKYEVPKKFEPEISLTQDELRNLVRLLAERLGILRDTPEIRSLLQRLPLIELDNGDGYAPALQVYIGDDIRELLGPDTLLVIPTSASILELYKWLGVADKPRIVDVINRIISVTSSDIPTDENCQTVVELFKILANKQRLEEHHLAKLRSIAWLPAKQKGSSITTRWFKPKQLFNTYQDYLFSESTALFLDIDRSIQNSTADLCKDLEIQATPTVDLVVEHLSNSIDAKQPVNIEVYKYLNRAVISNNSSTWISDLKQRNCILLNNIYVHPAFVYWGQHPFGSFRETLHTDWLSCYELLSALGVKDTPDFSDYCNTMHEISYTFADEKLPKNVKDVIYRCWRDINYRLVEKLVSVKDIKDNLSDYLLIPNRNDNLVRPKDIVFEDRRDIAHKFDNDEIAVNIIPKDDSLWRAMQAAGVRAFREAVSVQIVELKDPVEDEELTLLIRERKRLLKRVLDAELATDSKDYLDRFFEGFVVYSVRELAVQYELDILGGIKSNVENVSAQWQSEEDTLFLVGNDDNILVDVARELAFAIYPTGNISSWIKDIITAKSPQQASILLDRQGYPPSLEVYDFENSNNNVESPGTVQHASQQNVDEQSDEIPSNERNYEDSSDSIEGDSEETNRKDEERDSILSNKGDEKTLLTSSSGKVQGKDTESFSSVGKENEGEKCDKNKTQKSRRNHSQKQDNRERDRSETNERKQRKPSGKLRSYVVTHDAEANSELEPDRINERLEVDRAGISFVMEFERANGRKPQEMPHHNVGYDVLSYDLSGQKRFIEVKSLSGYWNDYSPAGLSKAQFEMAREKGESYWLYVVETANTSSPRLYCIQNPAYQITQYLFDNGWISISE